MLKIQISSKGISVNDYHVEMIYQGILDIHKIEKNENDVTYFYYGSFLLFDRFRVGVKEGDISCENIEFWIEVNNKLNVVKVDENGRIISDVYIPFLRDDLLDRLIM